MKRSSLIEVNNAHWTIAGQTGSGKTVLSTELITASDRAVMVHDPKGDFEWPQVRNLPEERRPVVVEHIGEIRSALSGNRRRGVIYRPEAMESQNPDALGAFFQFAYDRKNTLVYEDEAYSVTDLKGAALRWYLACLTRGRSRGVFVGSSTQRPVRVPMATITEVRHLFVFQLHYVEDRKRLAANAGRAEFLLTPQDAFREFLRNKGVSSREIENLVNQDSMQYGFWYYQVGSQKPTLYKGLEMTPGRAPTPPARHQLAETYA